MKLDREDYQRFWDEVNTLVQHGFRVHEGGFTRTSAMWADLFDDHEHWWSLSVDAGGFKKVNTTDPDNPEEYE